MHNTACGQAVKFWSTTKKYKTQITNATQHFNRRGAGVGARTLRSHVAKAHRFMERRQPALVRTRPGGDAVKWNPFTNRIGVRSRDGAMRAYFRADSLRKGWRECRK